MQIANGFWSPVDYPAKSEFVVAVIGKAFEFFFLHFPSVRSINLPQSVAKRASELLDGLLNQLHMIDAQLCGGGGGDGGNSNRVRQTFPSASVSVNFALKNRSSFSHIFHSTFQRTGSTLHLFFLDFISFFYPFFAFGTNKQNRKKEGNTNTFLKAICGQFHATNLPLLRFVGGGGSRWSQPGGMQMKKKWEEKRTLPSLDFGS